MLIQQGPRFPVSIRKPSALFKLFQLIEATDPAVLVLRHCFRGAETFLGQDKLSSLFKITQRDCYQCLLARIAGPPQVNESSSFGTIFR